MNLNGGPGSQHQQTRYGGEIREDSWGSGGGDLEVSVKTPVHLCGELFLSVLRPPVQV